MTRTVYYVSPAERHWKVKKQGAAKALELFDRETDAIEYAKGVAQNNMPSQVKVQKADGVFGDEWTYGDDPFPPGG